MAMEGLNKIFESKSKTFLAFCFCFIFGVGISSAIFVSRDLLFPLFISFWIILFFIVILWSKKEFRFFLFCFLFFFLGGMRYFVSIPENIPSHIRYYNGQKLTITGWVSEEPAVGQADVGYVIYDKSESVSGKVLVKLPLYPRYNYGDELSLTCNLVAPKNYADSNFNYQQYLARQGIWSVCQRPIPLSNFQLVNGKGNSVLKKILWLKSGVGNQIDRLWPEPKSSFMAGLLYGARSGLPKELTTNFSRTGITHIIAVSGFNISIIASVMMVLLIGAGLYRRQAFWLAVSGIILFVLFTGASASVVRAGIMGIIVLIAQQLGRLSRVGNVLAITAALMLLFNPYILIWDAGFQLSFLATIGLVYISPILQISKSSDRSQLVATITSGVYETLTQTLSAIIATLPLILFQFGRLSIVAPLVNVLVLWIIPWLMLFGFLAVVISFVFFPFGQVIAWIGGIGLDYVIIIVNWFGKKSWSAMDFSLPWWGMILSYLFFVVVFWFKNSGNVFQKSKDKNVKTLKL
jgi:competence protein ComEC